MTPEIVVVGGFYREICWLPEHSDETWGSGDAPPQ